MEMTRQEKINALVLALLLALLLLGLALQPVPVQAATASKAEPAAAAVDKSTLTIRVTGLRNRKGRLLLSVYDDKLAFDLQLSTRAVAVISAQLDKAEAEFSLAGLRPGRYAIALFHDQNNNGVFDMEGARPLEGYAYSNQAGRHELPPFEAAAVTLMTGNNRQALPMIYF